MAPHDREQVSTIEQSLFEEGYRFDFYQAVKLIDLLTPVRDGINVLDRNVLRFRARVGLSPLSGIISDITRPAPGRPVEMIVNHIGLVGIQGPMPTPYAELAMERTVRRDTALRDFLDIFNHRLVCLDFLIHKQLRPALDRVLPDETRLAYLLYCLAGFADKERIPPALKCKSSSLLLHTASFSNKRRSMASLERLLSDYFEVPVEGRQLCGAWLTLNGNEVTLLGRQNRKLGLNAVLGARAWNQQSKFDVLIGELSLDRYMDLHPGGQSYGPLCELIKIFAGAEFEFDIVLKLKAADVPSIFLGSKTGSLLGWTSWLRTTAASETGCSRLKTKQHCSSLVEPSSIAH
jgi:type VI secretion system protein ImpH